MLPRGNGKSQVIAAVAVWHLLRRPDASVYIGAASADQAGIVFKFARQIARHPAISGRIIERWNELRCGDGFVKVIASDGGRAHGSSPTMCIADELWAWKNAELLDAFQALLLFPWVEVRMV